MSKALTFADLRDTCGKIIQLVDTNEPSIIRSLKPESAVSVSGVPSRRVTPQGDNTALELQVSTVQVVNQASTAAADLTTSNTKEWPGEYRYMQLRQPSMQQMLRTRAAVMSQCRSILDSLGFLEVETPLLFKSTPEGAREFLVPTRKKGFMYALPQSPQQYKQLLMASGVYKYYQIAKCFRDEDLRKDRQPEFTQLDIEMAFSDGNHVRKTIEEVVKNVWKSIHPGALYTLDSSFAVVPCSPTEPLSSISYADAISTYGIDKPDLRCSIQIQTLSEYAQAIENDEFPVLESVVLRNLTDEVASQLILQISDPTNYTSRVPRTYKVPPNVQTVLEDLSSIAQINDSDGLLRHLSLQPGDVVAFSTRQRINYENPTPLGRLRQLAFEQCPQFFQTLKKDGTAIGQNEFISTWVVDFPLFTPVDNASSGDPYPAYDYSSLVSTHHPFTMSSLGDIALLETNPLAVHGQHYDLVINGVELGGGSARIHDVELQQYIFDRVLKIENSKKLFGHLLEAFSTGCPPHAGFAIGFDRMLAILCGTNSVRDVIAFPKTITGADPMIGSPSKVTKSQILPYHVNII